MAEYILVSKLREDSEVFSKVTEAQQLRAVNLGRGQKSRDHADQHRRQKNVALGGFHLFRQSRDAVEPNISKHSDGRAVKHAAHGKSLRVIERAEKKRF